jgi:hypothetical protein
MGYEMVKHLRLLRTLPREQECDILCRKPFAISGRILLKVEGDAEHKTGLGYIVDELAAAFVVHIQIAPSPF